MNENEKIKLLVVDDEVKFLQAITNRLKLKSFEITSATNGEKAIEAAGQGKFDVAVIDLQMPGIDGIQVLKTLKQKHKFLEVIILTGHATIEIALSCLKLGAFTVLEKSSDINILIQAIKDASQTRLIKESSHDKINMGKIQDVPPDQPSVGKLQKLAGWIKPKK